jgi:hypothetical protein
MDTLANPPVAENGKAGEISTATLLETLGAHKDKALIFHYDGHDVKPSYHVTEVKSGSFNALDCGANPESWSETFVQLWDIVEENRGHMPAGKFLAIMRKVSESVPFAPDAKLTFEVSDGVKPIQLYKANAVRVENDVVRVPLSARPSSCKPRDRWLAPAVSSCCTK